MLQVRTFMKLETLADSVEVGEVDVGGGLVRDQFDAVLSFDALLRRFFGALLYRFCLQIPLPF